MAAYTSTQSGNWNDVATWGGGGTPSLAGDTATVSAGHTVTYNVSSTVELGAITVNGLLKFLETASTKLTLGNVTITVNSGGELRVGDSTTVIGSAYLAELIWNTTSDNANGITINAGGKLTAYGDPAVYGSDSVTTLAADWNSAATDTFTIVGNYTAKWAVGQEITAHKYTYGAWGTDTARFTILAITLNGSNTNIQVSGGIPSLGTFYTKGRVSNVTRNVKLYKLGASTVIGNYNTNRPRILDSNTANNNCNMSNVQITGFYSIRTLVNFKLLNSVVRNSAIVFYIYGTGVLGGAQCSGFIYSVSDPFYVTFSSIISADVYNCSTCFQYSTNASISGDIYGNNIGFGSFNYNLQCSGNVYSNSTALSDSGVIMQKSSRLFKNSTAITGGKRVIIYGSIGWDKDGVSAPNTIDYTFWYGSSSYLRGAKLPSAGLVFSNRNAALELYYRGFLASENHGQVNGAQYRYGAYGDIIRNTATIRTGGANNSIEVVPLSNCSTIKLLPIIDWKDEWVEFAVPASAQTRTVYIKGEGWTVWPDATELWFEAEYISDATTLGTTIIQTTAVLVDNTTWTAFTINFTPVAAGIVRYRAFLGKYQAASKIYIDNKLYTS
jgi:hypothetical protein